MIRKAIRCTNDHTCRSRTWHGCHAGEAVSAAGCCSPLGRRWPAAYGCVVEGARGGASGPMVGRDRELARVMLLLDDALAGGGRLVLCTGEAGIGKTRLAGGAAAAARARGGAGAGARAAGRGRLPPDGL